jgi:hypothetical protein
MTLTASQFLVVQQFDSVESPPVGTGVSRHVTGKVTHRVIPLPLCLDADSAVDAPRCAALFVFDLVFESCKARVIALCYLFVDFSGTDIQNRRQRRGHFFRLIDST